MIEITPLGFNFLAAEHLVTHKTKCMNNYPERLFKEGENKLECKYCKIISTVQRVG